MKGSKLTTTEIRFMLGLSRSREIKDNKLTFSNSLDHLRAHGLIEEMKNFNGDERMYAWELTARGNAYVDGLKMLSLPLIEWKIPEVS